MLELKDVKISVLGLGYVGLPLAAEFGKHYPTIGFDVDATRLSELREGFDRSREIRSDELRQLENLSYTSQLDDLRDSNVYIVTVPTPIDEYKQPDLSHLVAASRSIGKVVSKGDVVVFESTVYPGATEDDCVPEIEAESGLRCNEDFFVGYSPERINPGDREHRLVSIKKVTAGSTPEAAEFVDRLYASIVEAGTHRASSIRVAEAAKVIENTQRDVNIALVNELALIFNRMGIDTQEVIDAAASKWNFLPFRPGLVGGHCIGVDPYYLTHKAQAIGYQPEIILAGRRLNDSMGSYIVHRIVKMMMRNSVDSKNARILVLGLTFKENCPDFRNTRVVDIVSEFQDYGLAVDVFDPWVDPQDAINEIQINPIEHLETETYDAVVLAVAHRQFIEMGEKKIRALCKPNGILFDVKGILPKNATDGRL